MFEQLSIEKYNEILSSKAPTPGGGSALAMVGTVACSLVEMAINVTIAKLESDSDSYQLLQREAKAVAYAKASLYRLSNDDATAFDQIVKSKKLPKSTPEETKRRELALQKAYHNAALIPLDVMRVCDDLLTRSEVRILPYLNKYVSSDCVIAIDLFKAILRNSKVNVYANTCFITAPELKLLLEKQCEEIANKKVY